MTKYWNDDKSFGGTMLDKPISYHIISYHMYMILQSQIAAELPTWKISGTVNVVKSKVSRDPVGRSEMLQ